MAETFEKDSLTVPGLEPRLLAAGWFAGAACLPVFFFFFFLAGVSNWMSTGGWAALWLFGMVPVSAAAFCGFTVGSPLADPAKPSTAGRTAMRGIVVALLSYVLFMAFYSGGVILGGWFWKDTQDRLSATLVYFVCGLIFVGWLIVLAGAFAGPLLKDITNRRGNVRSRPVSYKQALWWKMIAGLLFLLNYLVIFWLMRLDSTI